MRVKGLMDKRNKSIIKEIERNKGTQFDPKIADVFLKLMKSGKV